VVLLRDTDGGVEVYLMRRVASMAFAAGMYVFPGGVVDRRDGDADVPWAGPPPQAWAERLSAPVALVRALVCAALRETFEETGVLLAGPDPAERERQALVSRALAFSDLLIQRRLLLRADLIAPWTHWITPEFEERRYDTRFFVAAMPPGQRTRAVGGESDEVAWFRPGDALDRFAAGTLALMPPTVTTLEDIAAYGDVAGVLAAAGDRTIAPILPRAVPDGASVRLVLPGDEASGP
jgi:8-oxo-dGTP pyrophosphatase MutT (NUDIX family)